MPIQGVTAGVQQSAVLTGEAQRFAKQLLPANQETSRILPGEPPPYIVNISARALDLSPIKSDSLGNDAASAGMAVGDGKETSGPKECQTCSNRRYVDRSGDATVSFQSPTRVAPEAAETAVRAHEQEHVNNEQAKAGEQRRKVVAQSVAIHYGVCPECGRSYVAGGTTTTVTRADAGRESTLTKPEAAGSVDLTV